MFRGGAFLINPFVTNKAETTIHISYMQEPANRRADSTVRFEPVEKKQNMKNDENRF